MQWINLTVGEYCPFVYGKAIKKQEQYEQGIPVFGSNGVYTYSKNELVKPYAVIIGRKGTVGKVHLSPEPCWVSDTAFYIQYDSIDEARFAYYLLSTLGLEDMNTDAAVPGLNRNNAHRLEVSVPETPEQRQALIEPLVVLDKKIELNRQINQTLEAMAQAIFKSWFVDFDPVKAKVAVLENGGTQAEAELAAMEVISGKTVQELEAMQAQHPDQYQQLQQTASLFPDAMQHSELGEIPIGWEVKFLKDVCSIAYGKNLPTNKLNEFGYPVFGGNGVIGFFDKFLYQEPMTLVACRGAASGKVLRSLPFSFVTNNSLVINHSEKGCLTQNFVENSLKLAGLENYTTGSAQPQMTIANMDAVQILNPSHDVIKSYELITEPLLKLVLQNNQEGKTLSELRDTLLPKLLSGELQISTEDAA
jgi:type I restriction enzyme S subunit